MFLEKLKLLEKNFIHQVYNLGYGNEARSQNKLNMGCPCGLGDNSREEAEDCSKLAPMDAQGHLNKDKTIYLGVWGGGNR